MTDTALLARQLRCSRTMDRYCLNKALLAEFDNSERSQDQLRRLVSLLLETFPERVEQEEIPDSIAKLLAAATERIGTGLAGLPSDFYRVDNDSFLKDLAILLLALLPCGAEYVQVQAGIPRSLLWRAGPVQALRGAAFFGLNTKGFKPFLSLHMDERFREEFSPAGWHRTYMRIADLLRARTELKGVFGTAWFYDPAMAWVSPHLVYLREEREAAGAMTFCYGPGESALRNALARSETRRKLHAKGQYEPMHHYIVWPRADLIRWADIRTASGSAA